MSKQAKHNDKMARKRSMKAARRSQYAALAGTSKKTKNRFSHTSTVAGKYKHAHVMADCGNPGCQRCQPRPMLHGASGL